MNENFSFVQFYMDVHVPRAITNGLRLRSVNVLTAQEDGNATLMDTLLLDRATTLQRVMFSFDEDMLVEANRRHKENISFAGLIHIAATKALVSGCIDDLELIAKVCFSEEFNNRVEFLPL